MVNGERRLMVRHLAVRHLATSPPVAEYALR